MMVSALCASFVCTAAAQNGPYYSFVLYRFHIDKTRARNNDTDVVNFAIKVADQMTDPQIRYTGDVNDGDHDLRMAFGPMPIPGADTPVIFNYQIMNAGNKSHAETEKILHDGMLKLFEPKAVTIFGSGDGGGISWWKQAAEALIYIGYNLLTAVCDGPVATDEIVTKHQLLD